MRENQERWRLLCEQAASEQDPQKLVELVKEINALLEAKNARLRGNAPAKSDQNPASTDPDRQR